jgi:hypothetical protein
MGKEGKRRSKRTRKKPEAIDHAAFLRMLSADFPEVPRAFDESVRGLLHCEMGVFAGLTEAAMDAGSFWQAERYFRFVERVRASASPELENAIDVSYLESLAWSEVTDNRHRGLKRMPEALRAILLEIDGRGRWE